MDELGQRAGTFRSRTSYAIGWQKQVTDLMPGQRVFIEARIGGVYGFIRTLPGRYHPSTCEGIMIAGQEIELTLVECQSLWPTRSLAASMEEWAAEEDPERRAAIAHRYFKDQYGKPPEKEC